MKWNLKLDKIPTDLISLKKIILKNRGIISNQDDFFNPKDPMDITFKEVGIDEKQLKLIIQRIKKAKKDKQYIVIFGDYDADGISATAILWEALYSMGCDVKPFIPSRKKHGYGVSIKAIDHIISSRKPDLIITVDNGIVAHEPISYLKNKNIDVIITDHHQPETKKGKVIFPNADFILHSNKLCGATVAWMLAREINALSTTNKNLSKDSLDLCGIATIADQVSLLESNRSFAKAGLEAIKKTNRIGLKLLLKETVKDLESFNSDSVGFVIAPRINAMGRLEEGIIALRFLCTKSKRQAQDLLEILLETNERRKNLTYELLIFAEKQIEAIQNENILITYSENYHEGILGLIAGSILEKHNKPAIAISIDGELGKASVRSIPGLNIVDLLRKIREDLLEVGGHPMAAGFSFQVSKLEIIKSKLFKLAKETIVESQLIKTIEAECVLPLKLIDVELIKLIETFEPFGQDNRKPLFEVRDLEILEISAMGKEGAHLRLKLGAIKDKEVQSSIIFKAVGWRMGSLINDFTLRDKISVIGSLEFNVWRDKKLIQMILKDIKKQKL